jgi:cytidylate kinase
MHTGERVSEALIRAQQHGFAPTRRERATATFERSHAYSIALSREAGTQGTTIAHAVGSRLSWAVYDHEILELIARDLRVGVKLVESVDERHVNWLQEAVEQFCNVPAVREGTYVRRLIETILSLAADGRCVVVGRGAPFVMPAASTLRVRLTGPLEERISNVCREKDISRNEAARWIAKTDLERTQFVKLHFLHDAADARHYDLALNTSGFAVDECAGLIVDALHSKLHVRSALA